MENLQGKTAFITGGASGMGLGIAKACAREGMKVVIADFRQSAIDDALKLFKERGWTAHGICLDVTNREAYVKAADEAEAVFGKIHILVNNAGISTFEPKIPKGIYDWKDIDFDIDVNYKGVLNGIVIITPRILKHGEGGYIVSTASMSGLVPVPNFPLYDSLKMAVITLMEELAIELQGTGVGSAAFCPGPYTTNLGTTSGELRKQHLGVEPPVREIPKDKDGKPIKFEMPKDIDFTKISRHADEAGERVIRGIKRGDLYILTHVEFKEGWVARANAIANAFPDEPVNTDFKRVFPNNVNNPIFATQGQVPAFEYIPKD
jgi:NAD(P)-dependent dehydrogenase (short-subunit alcohol dehydrogenase family)